MQRRWRKWERWVGGRRNHNKNIWEEEHKEIKWISFIYGGKMWPHPSGKLQQIVSESTRQWGAAHAFHNTAVMIRFSQSNSFTRMTHNDTFPNPLEFQTEWIDSGWTKHVEPWMAPEHQRRDTLQSSAWVYLSCQSTRLLGGKTSSRPLNPRTALWITKCHRRIKNCRKLFCFVVRGRSYLSMTDLKLCRFNPIAQLRHLCVIMCLTLLYCCNYAVFRRIESCWGALRLFGTAWECRKGFCSCTHVLWCLQLSCTKYWFMCNPSLHTEARVKVTASAFL